MIRLRRPPLVKPLPLPAQIDQAKRDRWAFPPLLGVILRDGGESAERQNFATLLSDMRLTLREELGGEGVRLSTDWYTRLDSAAHTLWVANVRPQGGDFGWDQIALRLEGFHRQATNPWTTDFSWISKTCPADRRPNLAQPFEMLDWYIAWLDYTVGGLRG